MSIADKLIVIIGKLKASTFKLDCHICSFGIRKSLNCLRNSYTRGDCRTYHNFRQNSLST